MLSWNDLRDLHKGETGLVIGNGPSLRDIPLDFLRLYSSIGSNRIYLLFEPTYHVVVNNLVLDQFMEDIVTLTHSIHITNRRTDFALYLKTDCGPQFSTDLNAGVYEGGTITFVALQIAYWLGFSKVLLVGVDHKYDFSGQPNEENTFVGEDSNHFDPCYFKGFRWNNPDLYASENSYKMAREAYEKDGRRIVNCTTRTMLDIFDRGDWHDYAGG